MADELASRAQKNANLARIRDNQRRSRARRKDYLNELESKYRICEQVGVTASSEIQAAARRVIEENKRLRQMLKARGVPDSEIDGSTRENPQFPSPASVLEDMIGQRKPCCPGGDESGEESGRSSRCVSGPPPQPASRGVMPEMKAPIPIQEMPRMVQPDVNYVQQIAPAPDASYIAATSQPQISYEYAASAADPLQQFPTDYANEFGISYDTQLGWLGPYPPSELSNEPSQPCFQSCESSSCQVAADTIRTFKPDAGYELEQELGCRVVGENCAVANTHIFRVMDRYTDSAV